MRVVDARGPLPPAQSAAVVRRLDSPGSSDLPAHVAVTHRAMLDAIARARDHVNFQTYILEPDEIRAEAPPPPRRRLVSAPGAQP